MRPLESKQQALLLFMLALLLRCIAVTRTAAIFNDGPIFLKIADLIAQGAWGQALAHAYHPLYPICIAVVSALGVAPESAAIAVSVLGGSLAVVALYVFLCLAFDRSVGLVGATILAVHPYAIRFSADVQSDALYLALFLSSVAALYAALSRADARLAALAGALSGLGYLARPEGIGTLLVGVGLVGVAVLRGRWSGAQALRALVGLGLGIALTALPYWIALRAIVGEWQFSQKKSVLEMSGLGGAASSETWGIGGPLVGAVLFVGLVILGRWLCLRPGVREIVGRFRQSRLSAAGLASLWVVAGVAALLASPSLSLQFAADVISTLRPELFILLTIGVAARARGGPQGRSLFIATMLGLYACVLFGLLVEYGYLSRRHALPPLTLTFGYVSLGGLLIVDGLERLSGRIGRPRLVAALLIVIALISFPKAFHDHRGEELAGRRAAEWMRSADLADGDVAASKSKLGYYADRRWQSLHWQHALRGLADLESTGVHWVILEENALDGDFAPIAPLVANAHFALRERHRVEANDRIAIVFELESLR